MSYNLDFNSFSPDAFQPPAQTMDLQAESAFAPPAAQKAASAEVDTAARSSGSAADNERDLRQNPVIQELGVDFALLGRKLLGLVPFAPLSAADAAAPEMTIALPVMLVFFLFSNAVQYYFASLLYGAVLFKVLVQFLTQGAKQVEFYSMLSVLIYSSFPTIASIVAVKYTRIHALSVAAAILSCLSIGKQMSKGWNLDLVLICGFSAVIGGFWVLFGYV